MSQFRRSKARYRLTVLDIALALLILGEVAYRHLAGWGWSDLPYAPPHPQVNALASVSDRTMWAGSAYSLAHFDGITWPKCTQRDGMPGDDVGAIAIAPNGDMRLRLDGKCARYDGQAWDLCRKLDLLLDDASQKERPAIGRTEGGWSATAAPDGALWFGTAASVVHYTEYQVPRQGFSFWQVYDAEDGLPDDRVLTIAVRPGGEVWAGTARQFRDEVEAVLPLPSAQSRPAGQEG
ncbi:MAG TPA: hypothetical protein VM366_07840 [Anaerolineae bacterium]|nr:hypothetical protein [Anaerolineae bacterium]